MSLFIENPPLSPTHHEQLVVTIQGGQLVVTIQGGQLVVTIQGQFQVHGTNYSPTGKCLKTQCAPGGI